MKEIFRTDDPLMVGARLTLIREAYGLNQTEFSSRIGINANTYNQYEQGKRLPRVDMAARICDEYNIDLDWIFRGTKKELPIYLIDLILKKLPTIMAEIDMSEDQGQALRAVIESVTSRDFSY